MMSVERARERGRGECDPGQPLPQVSSAAKAGGIRQVSAEDEKTDFFTGSQLEGSKPVTLDLTLVAATAGLPITVEQFRIDLSQDDLADIAAGLIPVECLRSYAERFSKRLPTPLAGALVRCDDCQHFERIDHPHTGRCAQGHGRHWLWDTDKRQCEDFEAAVEGRP